MKLRQVLTATLFGLMIFTSGSGFASEKVMVDKEEFEQLKAAVKFLLEEREANKQAVDEAKQAAKEASGSWATNAS